MNNKKGQVQAGGIITVVMGLISLLLFVILFASFFPTLQSSFDGLRHSDNLNCYSTDDVCGSVGSDSICFNSSVSSGTQHSVSCSIISLGLPLIAIGGVIMGFLLILGGGAMMSRKPEYPGY